jgi:hypothetical protein
LNNGEKLRKSKKKKRVREYGNGIEKNGNVVGEKEKLNVENL